jgi:hypothetical protein
MYCSFYLFFLFLSYKIQLLDLLFLFQFGRSPIATTRGRLSIHTAQGLIRQLADGIHFNP